MTMRMGVLGLLLMMPLGVRAQPISMDDPPTIRVPGPITPEQLQDQRRRDAGTLYGMGLLARKNDRPLQAVKLFEEALQLDGDALEPRRALIAAYLFLGRALQAEQMARQLVEHDPGDDASWLLLALRLKERGELTEAVEALSAGLRSPRLAEAPNREMTLLQEQAILLQRLERFEDSAKAFLKLGQFATTHREALNQQFDIPRSEIDRTIAMGYERAGICYRRLSLAQEAMAAFQQAQKAYARLPDATEAQQGERLFKHLAELLVMEQRWDDALPIVEQAIAVLPQEISLYNLKLKVLRELGRRAESLTWLRVVARHQPRFVPLQLLLANELIQRPQNRAEAGVLLESLVEKHPNAQTYAALFNSHLQNNATEQILDRLDAAYKKATPQEGDNVPMAEREAAVEQSRVMIAALLAWPNVLKGVLARAAEELRLNGERHFQTWRLLGTLAARARLLPDAQAFLEASLLAARPDAVLGIYDQLIPVLQAGHQHDEVIRVCRQGLSRGGAASSYFYYHLSLAYSAKGDFTEALTQADLAIRFASDVYRIANRALRVSVLSSAGRHSDAIAESQAILKDAKTAKEKRDARYTLSRAYSTAGNHAGSEAQLRAILELDPNDATANNDLGYQMADQGKNLPEAEQFVRRALALDREQRRMDPDAEAENAAYLDSLGWVLFRQQRYAAARVQFEKASQFYEGREDPTVWDHLGDTYFRLNEIEAAHAAWKKALPLFRRDQYRPQYAEHAEEIERKLKVQPRPTLQP